MIKQLIKYLWKTYGPKRNDERTTKVIFTASGMAETIIAFADLLEKDGACQTIALGKTDSAVIEKSDKHGGGIKYHDILGPTRIIIIKENYQ